MQFKPCTDVRCWKAGGVCESDFIPRDRLLGISRRSLSVFLLGFTWVDLIIYTMYIYHRNLFSLITAIFSRNLITWWISTLSRPNHPLASVQAKGMHMGAVRHFVSMCPETPISPSPSKAPKPGVLPISSSIPVRSLAPPVTSLTYPASARFPQTTSDAKHAAAATQVGFHSTITARCTLAWPRAHCADGYRAVWRTWGPIFVWCTSCHIRRFAPWCPRGRSTISWARRSSWAEWRIRGVSDLVGFCVFVCWVSVNIDGSLTVECGNQLRDGVARCVCVCFFFFSCSGTWSWWFFKVLRDSETLRRVQWRTWQGVCVSACFMNIYRKIRDLSNSDMRLVRVLNWNVGMRNYLATPTQCFHNLEVVLVQRWNALWKA